MAIAPLGSKEETKSIACKTLKDLGFSVSFSRNCDEDDAWYLDQDKCTFMPNAGFTVINDGAAQGTIIGGNLCTLN